MLKEFKTFILQGNVVSLATGVIIGGAFNEIVKAFTAGIVTPLLGLIGGNPKVSLPLWIFDLGVVINAVIGFLITAAVIFFAIVKPMNLLMARMKKDEPAPAPPGPTPTEALLAEIRDSLKK